LPVTKKSPTALASKLGRAHQRFEKARTRVLEQGAQRKTELLDLRAEVDADLAAVENVLHDALSARKR
jgi:hypothetical protein